jgi:sporulation protein YlmC with PRC-barrel domain
VRPPATPARRLDFLADGRRFRIADGEPDPRGWHVVGGDAADVGVIDDLIVDIDAQDVRYLLCRPSGGDDVVLLPIGFVRLDNAARLVIVDVLHADALRALAAPRRVPGGADDEAAIAAPFLDTPPDPESDG